VSKSSRRSSYWTAADTSLSDAYVPVRLCLYCWMLDAGVSRRLSRLPLRFVPTGHHLLFTSLSSCLIFSILLWLLAFLRVIGMSGDRNHRQRISQPLTPLILTTVDTLRDSKIHKSQHSLHMSDA